jgi:carboxyl-terminal processing protease
MRLRNRKLALALVAGLGIFSACKKEIAEQPVPAITTTPVTSVTGDKLKDSALLYARDLYLWYNQIPTTFNAQSLEDVNKVMQGIRAYSIEPGFTAPVDRWSFAYKQVDWDNLSSGISQDFGLNVFFMAEGDLRVRLVEKASPAGKAGVRRGWRITKINGNSTITTANSDIIVKGVYESNSTSFTFQKPDGSSVDLTLNAGTYQENPVILDSVYTTGTKKVGYLAFNSFLGDTTAIYRNFNRVFTSFQQQGVNEVVVDLRYNGGGYVSVQEKLASYLVNSAANGNIMMTQQFNDKYTRYNSTTRFTKLGGLNLNRVFFIVSKSTASASELLINNLKPYMDVKVVGPSKTYGKPVGFFPVPVGDWYVFPVSFRTINKNGEGNYFDGIPLNNQVNDGLDKDWGDQNEAALGFVLQSLKNGTYRLSNGATLDARIETINAGLDVNSFKGSIGRTH